MNYKKLCIYPHKRRNRNTILLDKFNDLENNCKQLLSLDRDYDCGCLDVITGRVEKDLCCQAYLYRPIKCGHVDCLKKLLDNGITETKGYLQVSLYNYIITDGHSDYKINFIILLYNRNYYIDKSVITTALMNDIDCFKYLRTIYRDTEIKHYPDY